MNKTRLLVVLIAVAALPAFAAVTAADLSAFAQRVPVLPADSVAALAVAPQNGPGGAPKLPATIVKMRADLLAVRQTAALGATAGASGGAAPAQSQAQSQAQAEAMATKLKSMSQSEQIAYAMQMQQQMMPAPTIGVVNISAAEADAIHKIQTAQISLNADQQQLSQLQIRSQQFIADWDQQDQALSQQRIRDGKDAGGSFGADAVVCSEASRASLLQAEIAHKALADQQLIKAVALDKALRAQETVMINHADQLAALAAQISNKTMVSTAATSRTLAMNGAMAMLDAHADFYAQASARAAVAAFALNSVKAAKVGVCNGL